MIQRDYFNITVLDHAYKANTCEPLQIAGKNNDQVVTETERLLLRSENLAVATLYLKVSAVDQL